MSAVDKRTQRGSRLAEAHDLLEQASRSLVAARFCGDADDDVLDDLANLVTLTQWQCDAPDRQAINAACKRLRKAGPTA